MRYHNSIFEQQFLIKLYCQINIFELKLQPSKSVLQPITFFSCYAFSFAQKVAFHLGLISKTKGQLGIIIKMQDYGFGLPLIPPFQGFPPFMTEPPKPHKRTISTDKASEEQSFQPEYHHLKKLGIKVNKKKIQTGGWSAAQNQTYLRFMMDNINDFINERSRRTSKVFYRLSKILKRRTPDQCRSHHQKLQMKYQDDLKGIMQEVYKKIQRSIAQEYVNEQHRLFRPNFMFFREPKKAEPKQPKNSVQQPEQQKKSSNSDWYSLDVKNGCIKLEIKTESIAEWTIQ